MNPDQPLRGRTAVFYDEQCEICQAFVCWLQALDSRRQTVICEPLSAGCAAAAGLDTDACFRQLHILTTKRQVLRGWTAVAYLARLFPATWLIGALGAITPFRWLGEAAYGWLAANRYALSKCRGGACRSWNEGAIRRAAPGRALWTCHWAGTLIRFPLSFIALIRQTVRNVIRYFRVYGRRIDLLNGHLRILILNGLPCDLISLLFGEHFITILYNGLAIDPGPVKLRHALRRQLKRLPSGSVLQTVATHHHEEHAGNLNWIAAETGATLYAGAATAHLLQALGPLPFIRRFMIGQPPRIQPPFEILGERLGELEVFPAPGHCEDHIILYDLAEKILFAGDSFMGAYFSAPNPDVDTRRWIDTLHRLLELDIEILIEGHGFIHTLRPDIPERCPLVVRADPRAKLREKLQFCEWLRDQIVAGLSEGLTVSAIEVTCFPWGRRFS